MTSVQLYSVRDELEADPVGTLERLKGIGFDAVEPFDFAQLADRYAAALDATGLPAPSGHASIVAADDPAAVFAAARRLGITTVIEPIVREGWDDPDSVRALAARLNELAAQASEHGLTIGYHNHEAELLQLDGRPALELLAENLDPAVVLEVDVFWGAVAGADVPALLWRLGDRVRLLHVKDAVLARGVDGQVPLGQGEVDLRGALAAAPHAARVLEFDRYDGDLFDGLAVGLRALPGLEAA